MTDLYQSDASASTPPPTDSAGVATSGSSRRASIPLSRLQTTQEAFVALLAMGLWAIGVYPRGVKREGRDPTEGKEPFGPKWGLVRWTIEKARDFFRKFPDGNVGLCLGPGRGPGGTWLIDLEGDGHEAEESRAKLLGGEEVETLGWGSVRGDHQLLIVDGERLYPLLARLSGSEVKAKPGVYHLAALPGLELRIGGVKEDGTVKQLQSVCPPSPGTDGTPRQWNGFETIAEAPDPLYAVLGAIADEAESRAGSGRKNASEGNGTGGNGRAKDRPGAYLEKALNSAYGKVARAAKGERHAAVLAQTRTLAGYLHYHQKHGVGFSESELEDAMTRAADEAAPERKGDNPRCVRDAIDNGKASPLELPEELHRIAFGAKPSTNGHGGGSVSCVSPISHTRPSFSSAPKPIVPDLRVVPEFRPELLPAPLRTWALDIADRSQCALEYVAVGLVVALATVVGRKVGIRPKRHDFWTVVPNLWGMIVGRPGVLKTHALEEAMSPLKRLALAARERHEGALAEFNRERMIAEAKRDAAKDGLKKAAKKASANEADLRQFAELATAPFDDEPPTERRYITNDATVEKLGELLGQNPNGILQFRDELAGFLRSFEKQNRQMDRPFYLEGWNGTGSYTYDRIERGTIHIKAVCLSILGGIQPGPLAGYLRLATAAEGDDGLVSRFQISVYPDQDRAFKIVDRVPNLDARNLVFAVFKALDELDPAKIGATGDDIGGIPSLRFDDDAQDYFYRWLETLETTKLRANESPVIESHLSKYRSLLPSLALLFHLVELVYEGGDARPVPLAAATLAGEWCAILEEHARRIYQYASDGDIQPALTLAERLTASLPNPFVARDVQRKCWKNLTTVDEVQLALSVLEDRGWIVPEEVPAGEKGGRATVQYHVHPSIMSEPKDAQKK